MRLPTLALVVVLSGCTGGENAPTLGALIHAQHWPQADAAAAARPDPLAARLVTFYRLLAPRAASLAELDSFRAANPDWPQQAVLERRREEALAIEPDDAVVLNSCARSPPHGSAGLARCAEASLRQGQPAAAMLAARAAWMVTPSDAAAEAEFLRRWGTMLTQADHWARFDRLAWSDTAAAAGVEPLLAPADRPRAEARLALRRDEARAPGLVEGLPEAEQDEPALLLERVRFLRRARDDAGAAVLLRRTGGAAERAAAAEHRPAFWEERNLLARRLLRGGDAAGAYALVAETGQTAAEPVADAAFLAGWIALRRLGRPELARRHFAALRDVSRAAVSQGRAHFWLARAAADLGDPQQARREDALAAGFATTYYGQLAAAESDGPTVSARVAALRDPVWSSAQATDLVAQDLARAAVLLTAWGEPGHAAGFLLRLGELAPDAADQALVARLAVRFGLPQTAVALARRAGRLGVVLAETGWPAAWRVPDGVAIDPALALAVIRQESSFDPGTVSPAGARGLMQLMPATAAQQARTLGLDVSPDALTADPALNVQLGADYLSELLRRYGGSLPLALAAYNAGPSRVAEWLAANGDPRAGGPAMVDWIELIPLGETRNYVQRVIENAVIYRSRLGEASAPLPVAWPRAPA